MPEDGSRQPTPTLVNRQQFCEALGRSRQWIDDRMAADAAFPVMPRGAQGVAYRFDLEAVIAHVRKTEGV